MKDLWPESNRQPERENDEDKPEDPPNDRLFEKHRPASANNDTKGKQSNFQHSRLPPGYDIVMKYHFTPLPVEAV